MIIGIDGNEANIKNRVGVNQYAAELLCALEKLPEAKKHELTIYLSEKPLGHLPKVRGGWQYRVLEGKGFWILRKLTPHLWLRQTRPDVFFAPSHYAPLLPPMPLVISIMDLGYLRFPDQFTKYDLYQLRYWGQISARQAKKIIAISETTKKDILKNYPWTQNKVEVTHLGYDRKRYRFPVPFSQVKKTIKKYKIEGDFILYLGTLKPSKNIEGLLNAFAQIENKTIKLVIAGKKGWLYESVFQKVGQLDINKRVIFTDFVPENDKPALYAGAKALVSPSLWEGFGMHILEAMACGTPVIASYVGSIPEVIENAGILVNPDDPKDIALGINRVVSSSKNQYNELVQGSLVQAKKFSWEKTAKQTLRILEEIKNEHL